MIELIEYVQERVEELAQELAEGGELHWDDRAFVEVTSFVRARASEIKEARDA